jgi:hypothetical protein
MIKKYLIINRYNMININLCRKKMSVEEDTYYDTDYDIDYEYEYIYDYTYVYKYDYKYH